MSVTVENASATQVTLGTTVTAQQTSARAWPKMARSAATVGTVCVGSASARSREPLETCVRSARPAQTLAAPRGNGTLTPTLTPDQAHLPAHQALGLASLFLQSQVPGLAGERDSYNSNSVLTTRYIKIVFLKSWFHGDFVRK